MSDAALHEIADLLLSARGLLRDDHPPALRLALDVTLFQVGQCIAAEAGADRPMPAGFVEASGPSQGGRTALEHQPGRQA